jgi:two-component system invasion response regulator UvrY
LSDYDDMLVVGETANGSEAIDLLNRVCLDVLLLDLKMPGQSGADLLAQVRAKAPGTAVLIVIGYPEEVYASIILRQGASGYLDKLCPPEKVVDAIRMVAQGHLYVTADLAESMAQRFASRSARAGHEQLSIKEFQVLVKLAQGKKTV